MNSAPARWSSLIAFLSDPIVQAVLGVVLLFVVCAIAAFALSKLRDSNTDNQQTDELLRKNFEEMRIEGDINELEFRKIKALLADGSLNASSKPTPATLRTSNDTPTTDPS